MRMYGSVVLAVGSSEVTQTAGQKPEWLGNVSMTRKVSKVQFQGFRGPVFQENRKPTVGVSRPIKQKWCLRGLTGISVGDRPTEQGLQNDFG